MIPGQLLGEDFVRLGVRYIAIMENIDTAKGVSDIVSIQDLFEELFQAYWAKKQRKTA